MEEMRLKSKGKDIVEQDINQTYIQKLDFENARTLSMLRVRMLEVKVNFTEKYESNLLCEMCYDENENQLYLVSICGPYIDIVENKGKYERNTETKQLETVAEKN